MGSDTKKRQVSFEQLKFLLEFLKEHPVLAKGLTRGQRGRLQTLKVWNSCAQLLNVCKDGAIKDGRGWSKYWCDWKYRVRRRAFELRAAKESNKEPPDGIAQLSAMETAILNIIGHKSVDGVIIKSDPLADATINEDNTDNYQDDEEETNQSNNVEATSSNGNTRKRRHSSKDESDSDNRSELSSPVSRERKPRVDSVRETDDEASQFLELEREKLEVSKQRAESMQTIANELARLTDVLTHIRDLLMNNRLNNVI